MGDLFRFEGRIGRAYLWGVYFGSGVLGNLLALLPMSEHTITFGGATHGEMSYATPLDPSALLSWVLLAAFYLGSIAIFWVVVAALVKRRHDRGKSGRPVGYVLSALVATTALLSIVQPTSATQVPWHTIAVLVLWSIPFALGLWGLFELLFFPGVAAQQADQASSRAGA